MKEYERYGDEACRQFSDDEMRQESYRLGFERAMIWCLGEVLRQPENEYALKAYRWLNREVENDL